MNNYKIFDVSLSERYIAELTEEELDVLIDEANEEHLRIEREIDDIMWPGTSQIGPDGEPANGVWPSMFSYIPALYADEIAVDPGLRKKLERAEDLSLEAGEVLAVRGTAKVYKAMAVADSGEYTDPIGI